MKEIIELVGVSTAERPIKGFALDKALYVADTKQDVLDEQAISNERVASLVVWARDIAKFMVFSADGSTHDEKDLPSGDVDISDLVMSGSTAQLKGFEIAYDGVLVMIEITIPQERIRMLTGGLRSTLQVIK